MIIVVDSGSSKTDWRIFSKGGIIEGVQTVGLNPHHHNTLEFNEAIENSVIKSWSNQSVEEIYFYGSGVSNEDMVQELESRFKTYFKNSKLSIASDLLGAARALYRKRSGLVGILGTGSNSGWYDGQTITKNISPLGYVLGDEGSGNALGRRLVKDFLRHNLPPTIEKNFVKFYPKHHELIASIYSEPQPSRLLASFAPFVYKFREDEFIAELIRSEFNNYYDVLLGYGDLSELSLVGSIAYNFRDILSILAEKRGIKLVEVIKSPIDALTLYHKSEIL